MHHDVLHVVFPSKPSPRWVYPYLVLTWLVPLPPATSPTFLLEALNLLRGGHDVVIFPQAERRAEAVDESGHEASKLGFVQGPAIIHVEQASRL